MKLNITLTEVLLAAVIVVGIGVAGWKFFGPANSSETASVKVPELSPQAVAGKVSFDANCARCHGPNGSGTTQGPPLVHDIYNPGHHPDGAFLQAVREGVRQHHWPFGNMPAQPQVTDEQVALIVRYMRELQQANGIVYREHRM